MKKSELQQIIKEEIQKILTESFVDKLFKLLFNASTWTVEIPFIVVVVDWIESSIVKVNPETDVILY